MRALNQHSYRNLAGQAATLAALLCELVFSAPAVAEVYPITGVWAAMDSRFPSSAKASCFVLKTLGVEAVSRKSIGELIIFAGDKKYNAKGNAQTEAKIKSVQITDGGFLITETLEKRRWLGLRSKATYFLTISGPATIEIKDGSGVRRFEKCGPTRWFS